MLLENRDGLLVPRRRKHYRDGNRNSAGDQFLERHVDAVAHAAVVGADDEIDRLADGRVVGGKTLRSATQWRGDRPQAQEQEWSERTGRPRTILPETESVNSV